MASLLWNNPRDPLQNDRLSKNRAVEHVSYSAIWRLPHLLQMKFLDASLVGGDRGALCTDMYFVKAVLHLS